MPCWRPTWCKLIIVNISLPIWYLHLPRRRFSDIQGWLWTIVLFRLVVAKIFYYNQVCSMHPSSTECLNEASSNKPVCKCVQWLRAYPRSLVLEEDVVSFWRRGQCSIDGAGHWIDLSWGRGGPNPQLCPTKLAEMVPSLQSLCLALLFYLGLHSVNLGELLDMGNQMVQMDPLMA